MRTMMQWEVNSQQASTTNWTTERRLNIGVDSALIFTCTTEDKIIFLQIELLLTSVINAIKSKANVAVERM